MKNTTLCYLERDGAYLMLHRVRKANDENAGKWIGVGGHFLEGESPEDCVRREVREETGFCMNTLRARGIVTFVSDRYETELMHLFTSDDFSGQQTDCREGVLCWIPQEELPALPMWAGDRIFLSLLRTRSSFFSLKLVYRGEELIGAALDGAPLPAEALL